MDISKKLKRFLAYRYSIAINFIPEDEGGGVAATIPFLGEDAFVGDGETVDEAILNLNRLKEELFKYYLEKGIEIPPPPKDEAFSGKFVLRVPKALHQNLVENAQRNGVSLNQYCMSLLSQRTGIDSVKVYLDFLCKDMQLIKAGLGKYIFTNIPSLKSTGPAIYDKGEWIKYAKGA